MATFDDREKEFEARFKHDQELRFKSPHGAIACWGCGRPSAWGLPGRGRATPRPSSQPNSPAATLTSSRNWWPILAAQGHAVTAAQVQFELDHLAETAMQQVMSEISASRGVKVERRLRTNSRNA